MGLRRTAANYRPPPPPPPKRAELVARGDGDVSLSPFCPSLAALIHTRATETLGMSIVGYGKLGRGLLRLAERSGGWECDGERC
ncbi:hypothetical protein NL676_015397 [Syzygium grande]|nr:hypothetical protein NL676_015397 [Syzygium grande]